MDKKVTALIPTYQRPEFLSRAVSSVLNQTYPYLQVSIFDNASGDTTENIAAEFKRNDPRIYYHHHAENIGALKNFKYAFQSVNTAYFSVLSDDDALASTFYENAVQILEQHDDIMFVILNTLTIDKNADLIGNQSCTQALHFYRTTDRLNSTNIPSTWTSILFRKEVAQIYIEMDDRFDIAADMRFLTHAKARYHFAHLSTVGAFFTDHSESTSANRKRFDIIHHAVQISRYIEIYYDKTIDPRIKDDAAHAVRKMIAPSQKQSLQTLIETVKIAIKKICTHSNTDFAAEVNDAKHAGFILSAFFLHQIYHNKIIKISLKLLFSSYYHKLRLRQKTDMLLLQNGPYKKLFDELKATPFQGEDCATQS